VETSEEEQMTERRLGIGNKGEWEDGGMAKGSIVMATLRLKQ